MNKEIQDKLDWLINECPDPKRSQVNSFVIDFEADLYDIFYIEKYQTVYYDELAEWINELDEEKFEKFQTDIEELVNAMYKDAKENNMWGFVYDW